MNERAAFLQAGLNLLSTLQMGLRMVVYVEHSWRATGDVFCWPLEQIGNLNQLSLSNHRRTSDR